MGKIDFEILIEIAVFGVIAVAKYNFILEVFFIML